MSTNNYSDAATGEILSATFQGQHHILTILERNSSDIGQSLRSAVNRLPLILKQADRSFYATNGDEQLSPIGKEKQRKETAVNYLHNLEGVSSDFEAQRALIEKEENRIAGEALAPRAKDDITGTLIDLKIADILRERGDHVELMTQIRLGSLDSDSMRALAVLPPMVTGASQELQKAARTGIIHWHNPQVAAQVERDIASLQSAEKALENTYSLLAQHADAQDVRQAMPELYNRFDKRRSPILDSLSDNQQEKGSDGEA